MDAQTRATLNINEALQHRRSADLLIAEAAKEIRLAQEKSIPNRGFGSIVRKISAASNKGLVDGWDAEHSQELAHRAGMAHDIHRPWISWDELGMRTLQVGTAAQGGYLVGAPTVDAVDVLFNYSTVFRMGAQRMSGLVGQVAIPTITTAATAYALTELGTATESDPKFGQILCKGWGVGAYGELSRPLLVQEPAISNRMITNHLLGIVGNKIDELAIQGTGTDRPTGIFYTAGIGTQSGTTFAHATSQAMLGKVLTANAIESNVVFAGPSAMRELLGKRSMGTSAGMPPFIWGTGSIADRPAYVSSNVPATSLVAGDFSKLWVLFWGGGMQVEVNPYQQTNFQSGIVGFRVLTHFDVAVTQPAAFCIGTSIT